MKKLRISLDAIIGRGTIIWFDSNSIYIGEKGSQSMVAITELESLEKTHNQLNNRYFWRLNYHYNGQQCHLEFRNNYTLWNRNFKHFHNRLKEINPSAIRTAFHWWNI